MVFRSPYWFEVRLHHEGLYLPRALPKSPGLVQKPRGIPFREKCMSEGYTSLLPGASEHSSAEMEIWSILCFDGIIKGSIYSTYPFEK